MGFLFEAHNLLEMRVIDVCVYPEQPLKDCLHNILKIAREWSPCHYHAKFDKHSDIFS